MSAPFISVVSVAYKDAWALAKTARSVFCQSSDEFEYLIVDGGSDDGTLGLIEFWRENGLVAKGISEADSGVYDAMNKGAKLATGEFVVFMNAGDTFAHDDVLSDVAGVLKRTGVDGCLGWGELNGRIWGSWLEGPAFKLSSLGFCHQALYQRRSLLLENPFDHRPAKTDSDTLQLARNYERGATIPIVPEVWAIRGGEPGISANLERTAESITQTITSEYRELDDLTASEILKFRRRGGTAERILDLLESASQPLKGHLSAMVLDTLFQHQTREMPDSLVSRLYHAAMPAMEGTTNLNADEIVERLVFTQNRRANLMSRIRRGKETLNAEVKTFADQEERRFEKLAQTIPVSEEKLLPTDYVVALTSFPARISTVHFVIRSLVEQTAPPSSIHLFLGRDEIPNRNWLSRQLLQYEEQGLKIAFVDSTCHQYDKYLHGTDLNAERPYVIVDDDVIYRPAAMEQLIAAHQLYPNDVIGNRCHMMEMRQNGKFENYRSWRREQRTELPSMRLIPTGAGGVLYPKGFFCTNMVADHQEVLRHAPYADDIWLKFIALAEGRRTYATTASHGSDWYHRYTPTMRAGTLMSTNVERGLNDMQIARCAAWLDGVRPAWRSEFLQEIVPASQAIEA